MFSFFSESIVHLPLDMVKQCKIAAMTLGWKERALPLSPDFWLHKSLSLFPHSSFLALCLDSKVCEQV